MGLWAFLAAILAGAMTLIAFWLAEKGGKTKTTTYFSKERVKPEGEIAEQTSEASKKVELCFSDGSKLVLDRSSPYYQDFLNYADKILSKEEDAEERAHNSSS